jgi:hypothetical protein
MLMYPKLLAVSLRRLLDLMISKEISEIFKYIGNIFFLLNTTVPIMYLDLC